MSEKTVWGIYDTKDHCWMGNDDGPLCYAERGSAQIAAQILGERVSSDLECRFEPRELPNNKMRRRPDDLVPKRSAIEALRRIEGRTDQLREKTVLEFKANSWWPSEDRKQ